jgi:hypothetical protein
MEAGSYPRVVVVKFCLTEKLWSNVKKKKVLQGMIPSSVLTNMQMKVYAFWFVIFT